MASSNELVRICPQCAANLPNDANFCPACGLAVNAPVEEGLQNSLREFAAGTVTEIKSTSRSVLKSDTGKKMAAGAAIGAVAAAALPVIGWGAGAIIGAGFIAYKRLIK